MRGFVSEWIADSLGQHRHNETENVRWVVNVLQLPFQVNNAGSLLVYLRDSVDLELDVLDLITKVKPAERVELDKIFSAGGSAWKVDRDRGGLFRRVPDEAEAAYELVLAEANSASEHLSGAWDHAFGRSQDAGDAWGDAIRAVEAALHPIVSPQNTKATLGTMKGDLRTAPPKKFTVRAPGDDPMVTFLKMLDAVPYEKGRHGSDPESATLETARVVVLQATALVAAIGEGLIERA